MKWVARLALVALVAVSVGGCDALITKEVLFVNDSLTNLSVGEIVREFNDYRVSGKETRYAPNFGSSFNGIGLLEVPGVPPEDVAEYWQAHLFSLIEHVDPEVIVVSLGYNDCDHDLSTYDSSIDAFMTRIPSDIPVHWLTMHDALDGRTCDETINAALTAAVDRWSNLTILDFAGFMAGRAEWCADGVHLTDAGRAAYAKWLHEQLDAIYT